MDKMTNLGRDECKFLSEELKRTLQSAVDGYGLVVSKKGGKYDGATVTLTFDFSIPELAEIRANEDAMILGAEFKVGDTFTADGDEYRVTGFKPSRHKYPVIANRLRDGRSYKFAVVSINRYLG
jgi:hypothetical protein